MLWWMHPRIHGILDGVRDGRVESSGELLPFQVNVDVLDNVARPRATLTEQPRPNHIYLSRVVASKF